MILDVARGQRDAAFRKFADRLDDFLRGPPPKTTDFFVVQTCLLYRCLPCAEESPSRFVESDGNPFASKAAASLINSPYVGEECGTSPVLTALGPEAFLRHADFLPRLTAHGRLETEPALVVIDWMVTPVAVDVSQVQPCAGLL